MAKSIKGTQTEKNLLTSFAGESQEMCIRDRGKRVWNFCLLWLWDRFCMEV